MDNQQIAKQMKRCNKTAFDIRFIAITMVDEQDEKKVKETYAKE